MGNQLLTLFFEIVWVWMMVELQRPLERKANQSGPKLVNLNVETDVDMNYCILISTPEIRSPQLELSLADLQQQALYLPRSALSENFEEISSGKQKLICVYSELSDHCGALNCLCCSLSSLFTLVLVDSKAI